MYIEKEFFAKIVNSNYLPNIIDFDYHTPAIFFKSKLPRLQENVRKRGSIPFAARYVHGIYLEGFISDYKFHLPFVRCVYSLDWIFDLSKLIIFPRVAEVAIIRRYYISGM